MRKILTTLLMVVCFSGFGQIWKKKEKQLYTPSPTTIEKPKSVVVDDTYVKKVDESINMNEYGNLLRKGGNEIAGGVFALAFGFIARLAIPASDTQVYRVVTMGSAIIGGGLILDGGLRISSAGKILMKIQPK